MARVDLLAAELCDLVALEHPASGEGAATRAVPGLEDAHVDARAIEAICAVETGDASADDADARRAGGGAAAAAADDGEGRERRGGPEPAQHLATSDTRSVREPLLAHPLGVLARGLAAAMRREGHERGAAQEIEERGACHGSDSLRGPREDRPSTCARSKKSRANGPAVVFERRLFATPEAKRVSVLVLFHSCRRDW